MKFRLGDVDASILTSFNVGLEQVHLSKWAWTGWLCFYAFSLNWVWDVNLFCQHSLPYK